MKILTLPTLLLSHGYYVGPPSTQECSVPFWKVVDPLATVRFDTRQLYALGLCVLWLDCQVALPSALN